MALNVTRAEFPDWELLQSASIFHLSSRQTPHRLHGDVGNQAANANSRLDRLAKFIGADTDPFKEQYYDLLPLAQWHRTNGAHDATNIECWRSAKAEIEQSRRATRAFAEQHPTDLIGRGLAAYAAWHGCVTSGTESGHSIYKKNIAGRESIELELSTGELRLLSDVTKDDKAS